MRFAWPWFFEIVERNAEGALVSSSDRRRIIGRPVVYDENLVALMQMIEAHTLKPVIDKILPLDEAAEGLRLIAERKVIGKVVVTP